MKKTEIKIAYIGGGSRAWARTLMKDLAKENSFSSTVALYDIDRGAAEANAKIGNDISAREEVVGKHKYIATHTYKEALTGADFVIISVLPGTFDEMESDVHAPEKYGIYQSVGDTSGPGGIVRALRTIPMFREFAENIKKYCPKAWVINYTNPMTICVKTLYEVFPEIKAFGCCHEVFGTQALLSAAVEEELGVKPSRDEINVNVVGINHFTWITEAKYGNADIFPIYEKFVNKYYESGWFEGEADAHKRSVFACGHRVKFDLFKKYGVIAAAGDRHLAEFCPGKWYLENPEVVCDWKFALTPVSFRKEDLKQRLADAELIYRGEKKIEIGKTGEEGVRQIKAILGLGDMVTNCNLVNVGQIPNLPLGAVVETNAAFTADSVKPVMAGAIPNDVLSLVSRVSIEQTGVVKATLAKNYDEVFKYFAQDPLVTVSMKDARALYLEMIENTKAYIPGAEEYLKSAK